MTNRLGVLSAMQRWSAGTTGKEPPRPKRKPRDPSLPPTEHQEQQKLIAWLHILRTQGKIAGAFAVPNAARRDARQAAYMRSEGLSAGVPDIVVCLKAGRVVFVEMKASKGGRLSESQRAWQERLQAHGHSVATCHGFEEARQYIEKEISK
jgi:hypothetical protein